MNYAEKLGVEPGEVVRATTVEMVCEVVARAAETGQAVIPWGGGTGQTYGYVPERADILLDLSDLNRVRAHEFADLTITVEGGTTLETVQDTLARHNQFLPLDAPYPALATIGGILACNAFGPGSCGYGTSRDWLIGIAVVNTWGKLVRGGGKVVKNVTGYDIPKLHIGALGTLGIIVEATFKVVPRPETSRGQMYGNVTEDFVRRVHDETAPTFSLLRTMGHITIQALLFSGLDEVVQHERHVVAEIAAETGATPTALPDGMKPPFTNLWPETLLVVRVSGPRADAFARHMALQELGFWQMVDTLPQSGHTDLYLTSDHDPETALRDTIEWAAKQKVALVVRHAPAERRQNGATLWTPLPSSLPLLRRLKETLDPNRTLNPSRLLGL